jgi:hypothetical protein
MHWAAVDPCKRLSLSPPQMRADKLSHSPRRLLERYGSDHVQLIRGLLQPRKLPVSI